MAEDQQPDRAERARRGGRRRRFGPDRFGQNKPADKSQPNKPQPYRLGGGSNVPRDPPGPPAGEPQNPFGGQNPFEALFASLAGGDINALAAQLQNAFAMLGGAGSMFGGAAASGSGVNWDVTKDTARKAAASLGPDPTPDRAQQRAVTDAASIAEVWLDQATSFPRVSTTVAAWSRADWIEQTMPVWRRLVEPVATHIADAMENALTMGGDESVCDARDGRHGADAPADAAQLGCEHVRPAARPGAGPARGRGGRRHRHRAAAQRTRSRRAAAHQRCRPSARGSSSPAPT